MKNKKGFTLIEMLIALMIFSVVSTAAYGMTYFVTSTTNKQMNEADNRKLVRNVINQVTKDIQEALEVIDSYTFVQPNGDIVNYYYNPSSRKLIRELNGLDNIQFEGFVEPFSIIENEDDIFTITIATEGGTGVIESEEFKVARYIGKTIETGTDEDSPVIMHSPFALVTTSSIKMTGSSLIVGDVGSANGVVTLESSTIDGRLFVGTTPTLIKSFSTITGGDPIIAPDIQYEYDMPEINSAQDIDYIEYGNNTYAWYPIKPPITENSSFNNLSITNYMEVDVSDGDKIIKVNNLTLSGGSGYDGEKLILTGDNRLFLYVEGDLNITGVKSINSLGNSDQLHIILETSDINISGNCKLNGNIYVKQGSVEIAGSATIHGNIVCSGDNVEISGGNNAVIGVVLAPNAELYMGGSRVIYGWVAASKYAYLIGGGTGIVYQPLELVIPREVIK